MKKELSTYLLCLLIAGGATPVAAQLRTFVLGERDHPWERGGDGVESIRLEGRYYQARVVTGNVQGDAIEFRHRPSWISARFFDGSANVARLTLESGGSIRAPNAIALYGGWLKEQLIGLVNGDHSVAFERKPTLLDPIMPAFGIWVILDFGQPVGVERIRFYPRNTVVTTPNQPFQADFLRGYEVWINPRQTDSAGGFPDVLVARVPENEEPVVDLPVKPQYVQLVKIRSISEAPFEIDEIEVFGSGYLQEAAFFSDLIDLGGRATVGPVRWVEENIGDSAYSRLAVQMRTGNDDTPVVFRKRVSLSIGYGWQYEEVRQQEYWELKPGERVALEEDAENWSSWKSLRNGGTHTAPGPRRFVQFQLQFRGGMFDARQVDRLDFSYLTPPIADTLRAEIFPRLAAAEKPATFRYAVQLKAVGPVLGFDRLEVDTIVPAADIREVRIDGREVAFRMESIDAQRFRIAFPRVTRDGAVLEFTFDLPIFRFGTTFDGRVFNSRYPAVYQRLEPGQAVDFGPGDEDAVSGLTVEIPKPQIGKLVGEIAIFRRVFTPNGDGVNDSFEMFFNLLQLVGPAPVVLEIFDLAGQRVHTVFEDERGIGPVVCVWDGRLDDGSRVRPGNYVWVLRVRADAFEERHEGVLAVAY